MKLTLLTAFDAQRKGQDFKYKTLAAY